MGKNWRVEAWPGEDAFDIEDMDTGNLPDDQEDLNAYEVLSFIHQHGQDTFTFEDDAQRDQAMAVEYMKVKHGVAR